MLQSKSDRHDPLTWLASLGLRPRADTLPDLMQDGVDEDSERRYEASEQIVGNSA